MFGSTSNTTSGLKVLANDVSEPSLDIVAVHGLNGDYLNTWTWQDPKMRTNWLTDLLPGKVANARIMSFAYNANTFADQSKGEIMDHAVALLDYLDMKRDGIQGSCPIIFIAHSLGGLVVKQALVKAKSNPAYTSIMESTHSVIFFGTPHQGSEHASLGTVLQNIGTVLSYQQRSPLLETLKANCPKLEDLRDDFRHQAARYKIVSCFEQRVTRPLNSLVVEKSSAILGIDKEIIVQRDTNHTDLCRFRDEEDFEHIGLHIRRLVRDAQKAHVSPEVKPLSPRDLILQTEPIFQRLLTEFEEAVRDSVTEDLTPVCWPGYLNFYTSLGDSHLMNFIKSSAFPVDRPDKDGQTLLNVIISQQRAPATIRMIVEAGANPMLLDASGTTAVHLALRLERKEIAWMLLTLWKTKRGFGTGAISTELVRRN